VGTDGRWCKSGAETLWPSERRSLCWRTAGWGSSYREECLLEGLDRVTGNGTDADVGCFTRTE
jgi:hypothetical protein